MPSGRAEKRCEVTDRVGSSHKETETAAFLKQSRSPRAFGLKLASLFTTIPQEITSYPMSWCCDRSASSYAAKVQPPVCQMALTPVRAKVTLS